MCLKDSFGKHKSGLACFSKRNILVFQICNGIYAVIACQLHH